jgi:glycosyltransferase involved in cell wall biosynthesis
MHPVKIGIITNLFPPHARGGAEIVIVRMVGELLALGHEVFVITGQPKSAGKNVSLDRSSTEKIYRFFPKNIYFTLDDYKYPWITRLFWHVIDAFSLDGARKVKSILKNEQPDVVLTHNLKGIGLSIPKVIRELSLPHIHVVHDLQLVVPSGLIMLGHEETPWYVRPFYKVYQLICRAKIGQPDLVISPSHYLEEMYKQAGFFKETEMVVMPNPAPMYKQIETGRRGSGPLKLLYLGQLSHHKGVSFLIDAIEKLSFEAKLLIAGDGALRSFVEGRSVDNKRITYLGYMPPEVLVRVFGVVDALVVPSLCYENSPSVIYEGLQAGLPIIASEIGGVGELVSEGKNGFLFTPGSLPDFERALKLLDARKDEFANNREAIRSSVAEYTLDRYAKRLIEACALAVSRHKAKQTVL